jgi:hypothetical protein
LPISYWLFFKRAVLERPQVRALFAKQPLYPDSFRALVREKANPAMWGPSFCRKGRRPEATVRRSTNDLLAVAFRYYEALLHPDSPVYVAESKRSGGLGLFAKGVVKVTAGQAFAPSHIFGVLFGVTDEHFTALEAAKYPSLYCDDAMPGIFYGPLSLVNHECKAPLRFSLPRKIDAYRAGEGVTLEEFHHLPAIYARSSEEGWRVKPNQEITVDFFNSDDDGDGDQTSVNFFGGKCRSGTHVASKVTDGLHNRRQCRERNQGP